MYFPIVLGLRGWEWWIGGCGRVGLEQGEKDMNTEGKETSKGKVEHKPQNGVKQYLRSLNNEY